MLITENALIKGNLICDVKDLKVDGKILGKLEVKASDVTINGERHDASRIVSDDIIIGLISAKQTCSVIHIVET